MSIIVGDNFNYQAKKPLDSREQFASLADMKAYPDASLYDGCIAYVTANKKNYQYDSNNTVDADTGKWRELTTGGGGGGGSVPAGGTTGQALLKKSNADEDVEWGNVVDANAYSINDGLENALDTGDKIPYYNVSTQEKHNITWDNLKAALKTYFDTIYSSLTRKTPASGGTTLSAVYTGDMYNWDCVSCYGTCTTSASTTAKSVSITRGTFNFTAGARIAIKFSYNNTASAPTLTINSTTKNIKCIDENGSTYTPVIWWDANDIVEFVYDGTQFLMQPTTGMMFKIHGTTMDREDIYSTSEKVVGCWTDGRPLYQKTFSGAFPSTTAGTWASAGIGTISNLSNVIDIKGWYLTQTSYVVLPWTTSSGYFSKCLVDKQSSTGTVTVMTNNTGMSSITAYVTVKYTKTTDAANSFKYGDPNDYSTTEKIVGTWVDGKPLYQKTVSGTVPTTTDGVLAGSLIATGTTIVTVVDTQTSVYNPNTKAWFPIPITTDAISGNATKRLTVTVYDKNNSGNPNKVGLSNSGASWGGCTAYVTIKYTKT